ncbi:MAG: enoyl-CoA hydratase-related protein, partial [Streptosporangiaceae bacterium]
MTNDDGTGTGAALVRAETAGAVATLTLDSPGNANALSTGMLTQLRGRIEDALADEQVRVLVLTGAGKVFCSGADLKEALTRPAGATSLLTGVLALLWDSP